MSYRTYTYFGPYVGVPKRSSLLDLETSEDLFYCNANVYLPNKCFIERDNCVCNGSDEPSILMSDVTQEIIWLESNLFVKKFYDSIQLLRKEFADDAIIKWGIIQYGL
jgi:hypothetical protein